MNLNDYQSAAMRTCQPGDCADVVLMCAMGLCGESGEFSELVKKDRFQKRPLPLDKAIGELGDILWHIAAAAHSLGFSLQEIADRNLAKLAERYPDGFVTGGGNR